MKTSTRARRHGWKQMPWRLANSIGGSLEPQLRAAAALQTSSGVKEEEPLPGAKEANDRLTGANGPEHSADLSAHASKSAPAQETSVCPAAEQMVQAPAPEAPEGAPEETDAPQVRQESTEDAAANSIPAAAAPLPPEAADEHEEAEHTAAAELPGRDEFLTPEPEKPHAAHVETPARAKHAVRKHPLHMPKIVSVINLKGGVGKTTLTVALSEFLTKVKKKRVLVIDLDPQTNATVMLVDQYRWSEANQSGRTLHQMFLDRIEGTDKFDIADSIMRGVSNVGGGIDGLDLLPSSIDLIALQDRIPEIRGLGAYAQSPLTILSSHLTPEIAAEYDYILLDCPPNLGAITLNGIYISDYYLIPVIADLLSTYGISQICDRIGQVAREVKALNRSYDIQPLGVVVSKFRAQSRMHKRTRKDLIARSELPEDDRRAVPHVFADVVPESNVISEATDISIPAGTMRQKYRTPAVYNAYAGIMDEFLARTAQGAGRRN